MRGGPDLEPAFTGPVRLGRCWAREPQGDACSAGPLPPTLSEGRRARAASPGQRPFQKTLPIKSMGRLGRNWIPCPTQST